MLPERVLLIKSLRFTPCVAKRIKLSNGCKPRLMIATPECSGFRQIRCYAACAMIHDTRTWSPKSVYPQRHEQQTFLLLRAKTTQRVQGCSDLCRHCVAAARDCVGSFAIGRRAGVDHHSIRGVACTWIRGGAVHFVGF